MELQYEHIDWSDIVDAELSGDQEALRELRDRAAEMKREKQARPRRQKDAQSPVSRGSGGDGSQPPRRVPDSLSARPVDPTEYPMIGQQADKENSTTALPFSSHTSSAGGERANAASYAQMVTRKAKRTLVDRCLSPCEAPVNKRHVTSDIMKTPTEFKTFFHHGPSPSCETTPETGSLPGKAGLVQRRLFEAQAQEQGSGSPRSEPQERLTDNHRLTQRQKQIDYGKNTLGYERYLQLVPKWKRQKSHPVTPDKFNVCSTRSWQGQMRVWRRQLHKYDPVPSDQQPQFSLADAGLCNVSLDHEDC